MFTLKTSYKPPLLKGKGGGGVKSISRVDCEKQGDFCPNYVQEFGLCTVPLYETLWPLPKCNSCIKQTKHEWCIWQVTKKSYCERRGDTVWGPRTIFANCVVLANHRPCGLPAGLLTYISEDVRRLLRPWGGYKLQSTFWRREVGIVNGWTVARDWRGLVEYCNYRVSFLISS